MKRTIGLTLAVVFILALAAPVFAQDMSHTVDYMFNGTIDLKKTVGHFCNTGAEMKQVISGAGTMTKSSDIYMKEGYVAVDDSNDFVASATSSLSVTTAIKLCAPAKHIYPDLGRHRLRDRVGDPVPPAHGYWRGWDFTNDDGVPIFDALTKQIWAVQVSADPGFSGRVDTDFVAAYGPYSEDEDDDSWWFVDEDGDVVELGRRTWGNAVGVETGEDYVGNYFMIDQFARTSMGTTKRYIDISSPWSHAFLHEDMTVVGRAEVRESFEMMNIEEGSEATTDWWNLF